MKLQSFLIQKAFRIMWIDYSNGLKIWVDYHRAYKSHASSLEIIWNILWQLGLGLVCFIDDFSICKCLQIIIELSVFIQDFLEYLSIVDGRCYFQFMPDYFLIVHELFNLFIIIFRHLVHVKVIEGGSEVLSFVLNGLPWQSCLKWLQNKHFKEIIVVKVRHSPFFIMVFDI